MDDKDKIIDKIRKCLALASSANEHEAAAAMRQAQKLMELHRVTDMDLLAAGVSEATARAGANRRPAQWESSLAQIVAEAFGCQSLFSPEWSGSKWCFVGVGPSPEVASYAFVVLFRQLRRCRAEFISSKCSRLKPSNKTRRADLFCNGWVHAVSDKVKAMAPSEAEAAKLDAYMLQHYPALNELQTRDRNADRKLQYKDVSAFFAGQTAGQDVQLHQGVDKAKQQLIEMADS